MSWQPFASIASPFWALTNAAARVVLSRGAKRLPVPVLSVGNIVAGGVGKTELAALIAQRLVARGKRVVIACRGYGSARWEKTGGIAHDTETALSLRFPDEAIVLLRKAPGATVAVGANRVAVLERYWEELQPDVVILDDGFQHFALARDLDIVVHDFSVRWPILRDLPGALARAQVRVALSDVPTAWSVRGPWVRARYRLDGSFDAAGRKGVLPSGALAFCGLGNPSRFARSLEAAGAPPAGFKAFSDHHQYDDRDARRLAEWSRRERKPLLTTLKDFVKLAPFVESQGGVAGFEPRWVEVAFEFLENENLLWAAVDAALGSVRRVEGHL